MFDRCLGASRRSAAWARWSWCGGMALIVLSGCSTGQQQRSIWPVADRAPNTASANVAPSTAAAIRSPQAAQQPALSQSLSPSQPTVMQTSGEMPIAAAYHPVMQTSGCLHPGCQQHGCQPGCPNGGVDHGAWGDPMAAGGMSGMIPNPQGIDPNEFLCNGGDQPPRARARAGDRFAGVEVQDTVARYQTVRGETHVVPSNPVCVYAPRFGSVRRVTGADLGELSLGPQRVSLKHGPAKIETEEPGLAVTGRNVLVRNDLVRGPDAMRARDLGVPVESVLIPNRTEDTYSVIANLGLIHRGVIEFDDKPGLQIGNLQAIAWSVDQEVVVAVAGQAAESVTRDQSTEGLVVYELPNGRLRLIKLADRGDALPGETVTFILRVDNVGESPLTEVVITDSLAGRLQYIAESQSATVEAAFSTATNEDQSLQVTWKLLEPLAVGQGAVIEFKCLVR